MIIVKKPKIRFKGFTETWEQRKLEEICESFEYGLNAAAKEYDGENKYIRITDIDDNSHEFIQDDVTSPDIDLTNSENYQLKYGDVLFTRTGASVGKTYIYKESDGLVYYAGFLIRGRVKSNYSPEFIFQNTLTDDYDKFIRITSQRSGQPGVNAQEYASYEISVPKFEEQQKIGAYFSTLDHLITLHQRKCENLKKLKKFMLQKLFPQNGENVPKIRFSNFTDTWEQRKLGDMGSTFTGLSGKNKNDFGHGKAKFVTYMNVFTNSIANLEMTDNIEIDNKQNEVKYGDVFFTTSSETPDEVGMSSVWLGNKQNIYLNSFCFGFRPSVKINEYYLAYMLRSDCVRKKITYLAQGISRYNISKNKMMNIEIPLTNYLEQQKIGTLFSELDNLITLHQSKCDNLKELKKYMLQNMFI